MALFYTSLSRTISFKYYLLAVFTLLLSTFATAQERTQLIPLSLEERTRKADIIVEGEVVAKHAFWDARHENIYTSNIISVYKVFKGQVQAQEVEVITQGGTVGMQIHLFSAALKLSQGAQGIFFLQHDQQLYRTPAAGKGLTTRAYGHQQGFIKYDVAHGQAAGVFDTYASVQEVYNAISTQTGNTYRTVKTNERLRQVRKEQAQTRTQSTEAALAPTVTSFSPKTATAGTDMVLTIKGKDFGSSRGKGFVAFQNADDGGQTFVKPLAADYISWTSTQIKLRIPSNAADEEGTAGSGVIKVTTNDGAEATSTDQILIEYAYSNVNFEDRAYKPILIDKNTEGGYTVQFAPSMQKNAAAQEGFRRAMSSWVCNSTVNWKVGLPGKEEKSVEDNLNVIRFVPAADIGAGVLASTVSRWAGARCGTGTLFWLSEFDMDINSNINWQYGPGSPTNRQYDFQTVMLHELGHAHQLGHVIEPRAVMHYAIESEALVRDLSVSDIAGATFVMAKSLKPNICNEPTIKPQLYGGCDVAPEIYTFDVAFENGQVVANWSTKNEKQNDYFILQRSADGNNWEDTPGRTSAMGPSTAIVKYSTIDPQPLPRTSYYRLRIVYKDGSESFSPVYEIINPEDFRKLIASPNPLQPQETQVSLEYIVTSNSTLNLHLYTAGGTLVRKTSVTFTDANLPVQLDVTGIAAGLYILKWEDDDQTGAIKILKL